MFSRRLASVGSASVSTASSLGLCARRSDPHFRAHERSRVLKAPQRPGRSLGQDGALFISYLLAATSGSPNGAGAAGSPRYIWVCLQMGAYGSGGSHGLQMRERPSTA